MNLSLKIHLFCRLVDDISLIVQGQFSEIPNVLEIMASKFPKKMPLNCQNSSGYSRFLDLHILNMHNSSHNLHYNLVHTLAYKDTSTFNYTPASSNVHPRYKHAVVPIYLHRIHSRCTFQNDIDYLSFMSSLLLCRNQDSSEVKKRTHRFFKNKMKSSNKNCYCWEKPHLLNLMKFPEGIYLFINKLIRTSFGSKLLVAYKSCKCACSSAKLLMECPFK